MKCKVIVWRAEDRTAVGSSTFSIPGFSDLAEIGSGGFGTVYAATEESLERPVAVKVLRQGLDVSDRRRFERESRAMARVSDHPNVVTLYSTGYTTDDRPFIVMELVDGGSLAEKLQANGILGWQEVQHIGMKLADALSHAHASGVLHRDIKPANILMVDREPKLTDFGIASFLDSARRTSTNIAVSLGHAPPETFESARDERSDVYSLGSTLHTLLTGTPPFVREGEDSVNPLLNRLLNEEPPVVNRPDVPQDLSSLILETLCKDPNGRPQSAALLSRRLAEIGRGQQHNPAGAVGNGASSAGVGGALLGSDGQSGGASPGASGSTGNVLFKPDGPVGGNITAGRSRTSLYGPDGTQRLFSAPPPELRSERGSRRRGMITVVAAVLLVWLAGAAIVGLSSSRSVDDQPSGEEAAGPSTSTTSAPEESPLTREEGVSEEPSAAPLATTVTPNPVTAPPATTVPPNPVTAPPTTTATTTAADVVEPSESSESSVTQAAVPAAVSLPAPSVRVQSSSSSGLWVAWDHLETAWEYDYRVTVAGEQVLVVNTTSPIGYYQYEGREGVVCVHVTAFTVTGAPSPEGTVCHDPSAR